MSYDTAGKPIWHPLSCDCQSTGGCEKCNPFVFPKDNSSIHLSEEYELPKETEKAFYEKVFATKSL